LLDCRDCLRLAIPNRPDLHLYAGDAPRARALLARPPAQDALDELFTSPAASATQELYLQPDRLWLRTRLRMPSSQIAVWLEDLLPALVALAQTSEQS
jgi:hypothetical protein